MRLPINLFNRKRCFICDEKLGKNYAEILYRSTDSDKIQKICICSKCADEVEKHEEKRPDKREPE
jgi:hypothetical protein